MAKNRVYGFSRHPGFRKRFEYAIHMFFDVKPSGCGSPPPNFKTPPEKGGVFFCYTLDWLGRISFRIFVK